MTDLLRWIVFVHVAAAFAFAAGHGVSIVVAFLIRRERDPVRIRTLLDASALSLYVAGIGLLVLLVAGIAAGILAGSFGRLWIWLSLGLLLIVGALMTPIGGAYYNRIRRAVDAAGPPAPPSAPDGAPPDPAELTFLLDSRRPELLLLIGGSGFLAILWLMMFRPF